MFAKASQNNRLHGLPFLLYSRLAMTNPSYDSATAIINSLIAIHREKGNIILEDTFKAAYFQCVLEDVMVSCPQAFAYMQERLEIVKANA